MGRNGQNMPVLPEMFRVINLNQGKIIDSSVLLLGKDPGRNSATAYAYKFVKLGYIEPIGEGGVMDKATKYKVVKAFPSYYNSMMLMDEMRVANGLIPKKYGPEQFV